MYLTKIIMNIELYHNPRCSKSRQTLALIQEQGINATIIEYLKTPPSYQQLDGLLNSLKMQPRELMRTKESEYNELGLDDDTLTREQLINAMIKAPKLIERPILVVGDQAAIGRPPENVLAILP